MFYSIGAHPAFPFPVDDYKERENYYLEFPGKKTLTYFGVSLISALGLQEEKKALRE